MKKTALFIVLGLVSCGSRVEPGNDCGEVAETESASGGSGGAAASDGGDTAAPGGTTGGGGAGAETEGTTGTTTDTCSQEQVFPVCFEPCDCELTAPEMNELCKDDVAILGRAVVCESPPNPGAETGFKECKQYSQTVVCGGEVYDWYCCEP